MYDNPIKFTKTGQYGCGPSGEHDVYTVEEFRQFCKSGMFIDYDGVGCPVRDSMSDESIDIKPSRLDVIPADATHVVWYNR